MAKRRVKPKVLLLSDASDKSVMRLAVALALTSPDEGRPNEYQLENRAKWIIRTLRRLT